MTDNQFVEELKNKNPEAFREFVDNFQVPLIKLCKGFLQDHDDVKDVVQDTFIEVYNSIDRFRLDSKLSTWLYRIAVNKSINYLHKNKKRLNYKKDLIYEKSYALSDNFEKHETLLLIKKAVNSLPENQRIAFVMNKYMDLSYKEISEVMNITLSSVESLLHRAKINLQKKLYNIYKKK